jgi:lipid-binding SYLF domain-containing protein
MKAFQSAVFLGVAAAAIGLAGCGSTPSTLTEQEKKELGAMSQSTIADFKKADPEMEKFFREAYAYAVFPNVNAGAVVVGGAHGEGEVYRGGKLVGYADVSKANVGAQIGGQSYSQIVFFQNEGTFAQFTGGTFEMDAKASAVAAAKGASTSANYVKGVVVFTNSTSGLMVQAAIGGQKFRYTPVTP